MQTSHAWGHGGWGWGWGALCGSMCAALLTALVVSCQSALVLWHEIHMWFERFMAAIFQSSGCWIEASAETLSEDLSCPFFNSCCRPRDLDTLLQLSADIRLQILRCKKDVPHQSVKNVYNPLKKNLKAVITKHQAEVWRKASNMIWSRTQWCLYPVPHLRLKILSAIMPVLIASISLGGGCSIKTKLPNRSHQLLKRLTCC